MRDRGPGKGHSVGQSRDHLIHSSTGRPQPNQSLQRTGEPAVLRDSGGTLLVTGRSTPAAEAWPFGGLYINLKVGALAKLS